MSAVILGYVERCERCGGMAMLTQSTPGWVCPSCSGTPPEPADELVWDRAAILLRGLFGAVQPLLDTVTDLNDGDPEPEQLGQEEP